MTIESATFIDTLDATLPADTDAKSEGDNHLKLIKASIKATFGNVTGAVTPTHTELNFVDGVTSAIQTQLDAKAPSASPTFTGTAVLPATTSIGDVSATELAYVDGVTSAIQTQIDSKAPLASPALTGTPTAPTAAAGTATTQLATTAFVDAKSFATALPAQTGNAGKFVTTDGASASWAVPAASAIANTPAGSIAAVTVQAAIDELDIEKAKLGANTFTAAQEFATGANIASAATVDLDTATGNRVHITGTAAITAVTLTRGPRTVIFDGILTLTHHATNNNLPGAANITTAAGDRAIYESDGTTVYCVAYTRKDGTPVVSAGAGDHAVSVHSGNGHGSVNTKIRRFSTVLSSVGTDISYVDSATLGASFTINTAGIYAFTYADFKVSSSGRFGASVNSANLTTDIFSLAPPERLFIAYNFAANNTLLHTAIYGLNAGDVVRPHTQGTNDATSNEAWFSIRRIG